MREDLERLATQLMNDKARSRKKRRDVRRTWPEASKVLASILSDDESVIHLDRPENGYLVLTNRRLFHWELGSSVNLSLDQISGCSFETAYPWSKLYINGVESYRFRFWEDKVGPRQFSQVLSMAKLQS